MDTLRLIVAVVATLVAVPAAFVVVRNEIGMHPGSPARAVVEAGLPLVGLVVLVVAVWVAV